VEELPLNKLTLTYHKLKEEKGPKHLSHKDKPLKEKENPLSHVLIQPPKCKSQTPLRYVNRQMMMFYEVMSRLVNDSLKFLNVLIMFLNILPMFLNVPLTLFHALPTPLKNSLTFYDTPLMHSKTLLGFNHQP